MDQKITIRIADRKYALTASSPENEELIRSAAAVINAKLEALTAALPGKSDVDRISLLALNLGIGMLTSKRECDSLKSLIRKMLEDTDSYLEKIK